MWEIRKIVKKGDYLYAVVPEHPKASKHGYVLHHRVVMENHIGRILTDDEVVHHINHDKHDNHVDNLEVMDKREHNKLHSSKGRAITLLTCAYCGSEFSRETRLLNGKGLCSRKCNALYNRKHSGWTGKMNS